MIAVDSSRTIATMNRLPRFAALIFDMTSSLRPPDKYRRATFSARPCSAVRFSSLLTALTLLVAVPALGADSAVERDAKSLQKQAIQEDSLNVNYPEAIKKLAAALSKCGVDKCAATLRSTLYRDLGAMLILNGLVDDGRVAFAR